jgi:hypothetical protein
MSSLSRIHLATAMFIALAIPMRLLGQNVQPTELRRATVIGTATDANGDPVPNATIELKSSDSNDRRTLVTAENGFFEFHDVKPGVSYQISVNANDFADWTSSTITLEPGQFKIATGIKLRIRPALTEVQVTYDPVLVATEQLKSEESQRVFGILPNFYVSYGTNPAPLTAKMKFQLALRMSTDPVTAAGVALVSAGRQAANSPGYGQGWGAYGEQLGATAADGFSDIMIGGAILPSLLTKTRDTSIKGRAPPVLESAMRCSVHLLRKEITENGCRITPALAETWRRRRFLTSTIPDQIEGSGWCLAISPLARRNEWARVSLRNSSWASSLAEMAT